MNDNDFGRIAGYYTEYSQDFIDYIKQKDFKINYDIELDGEEQPDDVEIAVISTSVKSLAQNNNYK